MSIELINQLTGNPNLSNNVIVHRLHKEFLKCYETGQLEHAKIISQKCSDMGSPIDLNIKEGTLAFLVYKHGYLEFAKWLDSQSKLSGNPINYIPVMNHLAIYGQLEIMKWLDQSQAINYEKDCNGADISSMLFKLSCKYGQLEFAKWIYAKSNYTLDLSVIQGPCLDQIYENGYISVIDWLVQISQERDYRIDLLNLNYRTSSIRSICYGGHLDMLKWYQQHNLFEDHLNIDHISNQIMVKQGYTSNINEQALLTCCRYDNLEMAKWIYDNYYTQIDLHINHEMAFTLSCKEGNLEIAKWIYNTSQLTGVPVDLNCIYDSDLFVETAINGHLNISKWLYQICQEVNFPINLDYFDKNKEFIFTELCSSNKTDAVEWILDIFQQFNLHLTTEWYIEAFEDSCLNNCLNVATLLDNRGLLSYNLLDINSLFDKTCTYGHHQTARLLIQISNKQDNKINWQSTDYYEILRYNCAFGKLECAKWIYGLSADTIDIRQHNDYLFRTSCKCKNVSVSNWLASLCPDYYIDSDDDIIFSWKVKHWFNCDQADLFQQSITHLGFKLNPVSLQIREPCLICKETNFEHLVTIKCGHSVCLNCFISWFLEYGHPFNCVLCNQLFDTTECVIFNCK